MKKISIAAVVIILAVLGFVFLRDKEPSKPFINVMAPNGGEVFQIGTPIEIKWRESGFDYRTIYLAREDKNQTTYIGVIDDQKDTKAGEHIIIWDGKTVCVGRENFACGQAITPGKYKIYIPGNFKASNITYEDTSDGEFQIK